MLYERLKHDPTKYQEILQNTKDNNSVTLSTIDELLVLWYLRIPSSYYLLPGVCKNVLLPIRIMGFFS